MNTFLRLSAAFVAFLVFAALTAPWSAHAEWRQIETNVGQVVLGYNQIDRLTNVFLINSDGTTVFREAEGGKWLSIGDGVSELVAGRDVTGTTLYALPPDRSAVLKFEGDTRWTKVGGPTAKLYGGIGGLIGTDPATGDLFLYSPQRDAWAKIGGPAKSVAIGGPGEIYAISPDGAAVFRYPGKPGPWERIADATGAIYAAPGHLYRTDAKGDLFRYDNAPNKWTKIGGAGKVFVATAQGDLYGLAVDGADIYRYLGTPGQWEPMGQPAVTIAAQQDQVYAVKSDGTLWTYTRDTLPTDARMVVIAANADVAEAAASFAAHKRMQGMSVAVVAMDEVTRVAHGTDEAEKLRNFLIHCHSGGLLEYVLLLGDVDTIPTKVFFRDNGKVPGNRAQQNAYTTDFYYGNLHTTDWDLDNDGLWGEIADDKLDAKYDVSVGRIPFNDAGNTRNVLFNCIQFDKSRGDAWQRRVILAHGYLSANHDLAGEAEKIDKEILLPNKCTVVKLYMNQEKTTSAHYVAGKTLALTDANFIGTLSRDGQGLALLSAHGMTNGMSSVYVKNDGTDASLHFGRFDSVVNHPMSGIFVLNACNTAPMITPNGYPTPQTLDNALHAEGSLWNSVGKNVHGNIAKAYLRSGAVVVIASTVGSDTGAQVLEYEFTKELVTHGKTVGKAFAAGKERSEKSRATQSFYLVGDPTIRLK